MSLLNLFQLTLTRFLTVYIVQGLLGVFFLYLAFRILKRDMKRLNIIFSSFYIFEATGIFMNFIYAPLTDLTVIKILNFITNFFSFTAPVFILVFVLIILRSEKVIDNTKQMIIIGLYGALLFLMVFLAFIPGDGVSIDSESYAPDWGIIFFLYVAGVTMVFSTIPTMYFSLKIYNQFEDEKLKAKWKFFLYGIVALYIFLYGIFTVNTLNIGTVRTIWALIGLALAISASVLLYYGVGRQIE